MRRTNRVWVFVCMALIAGVGAVSGHGSYLSSWQSRYPSSLTDDNVISGTGKNCQMCHASANGGDNYNGYGWRLRQNIGSGLAAALAAAESHDSDADVAGGFTNLAEIDADTQPGWTTGPNNVVYSSGAAPLTGQLPPSGIRGNLDPAAPGVPDIQLDPPSLGLGTVVVGASASVGTAVGNLGDADLEVTAIQHCSGTSPEFSWSPDAPFSVPAGGSLTLTVSYSPGDAGGDIGCLLISSNDPDENPAVLSVEGNGEPQAAMEPDINLNPASLDFGTVFIGDGTSQSARVENLGTADLHVTMVVGCPGNSPEFAWSPTAAFVVPAGGSQPVAIVYTPLDEGMDTGCLEFVSDDPDENTSSLQIAAAGAPQPPVVVDYDISRFITRKRVSLRRIKLVQPRLLISNPAEFTETRSASLIGVQNGVEIYNQRVDVLPPPGVTSFAVAFPSYRPVAVGKIIWTVTIADDDPDIDRATSTTKVVR